MHGKILPRCRRADGYWLRRERDLPVSLGCLRRRRRRQNAEAIAARVTPSCIRLWAHDHRFFFTAENVYKGNLMMVNYYSGPDRGNEVLTDGVNLLCPAASFSTTATSIST